ncbi:glycerol-1-phosphate dehydrogenase [NAD(P)+] [Halanaerobium saccharolyticum]|uniref:Glycerol-1-phosphate dehydrogenase [NAD(P)+] n=1 Tax=Halanaerobium saccharolyticum TaxID=43595 RepID=A0A4R7YXR3_9FIRM|nr:sn-glycerol-1-phosphate dehydrogenase [Halanaerobium saccharolyticum]RAK07203.1 glycerol-1-phosphate dehydrogenase [NAD(P)+] [Halanaerobium saccharolyticum]TDW02116.1 glycerol-1-phosphate dehydrogenase [NAD(P)+] [Halanaerobium saccharolyticum]TDX58847.1 glycerol-1-phosphate dehydrogenase [NAD(P)+] [Halanaerobium saccharolyticum]
MDIKKISGEKCSCGEIHQIPIEDVIIEENALDKTAALIKKITKEQRIYLIVDQNTKKAAGAELKEKLLAANFEVEEILLKEREEDDHLVPEPGTLFKIIEKIEPDGYILACGSGSINDLTAYAAHKMQLPYSIFATAPSMDGYASSVSSITVNGVKKTYNTTPPELIIADLNILKDAPWKLIQSGLGDLLGKVSSLLEWKLGVAIFDEYFCQEAFDLVENVLNDLINNSESIIAREKEGIEILTKGLIYSGVSMMMVGSSRPASGTEHHISHFFDMYAGIFGEHVPTHGIKVGTAALISSHYYLKLLETDFSQFEINHDREAREKEIKEAYLDKAEGILELLDQRWEHDLITESDLLAAEEEIKNNIRKFEQYLLSVETILEDFGFFEREDVKNLNRDWLKKAVNHCFEIRFRYTISTLLRQVRMLDQWGEEGIAKLEEKIA